MLDWAVSQHETGSLGKGFTPRTIKGTAGLLPWLDEGKWDIGNSRV